MGSLTDIADLHAVIVGFGSIGRRHFENLGRLGVGRRTVVRRASGRNPAFEVPEGTRVVSTVAEAAAEKVDFAVICNPTSMHVDTALEFVGRGIPVLVEKPISAGEAEARHLVEETRRRGVPAHMAYCLRYHPAYFRAREMVRSGELGQVLYAKAWFEGYLPHWHPWEDYGQSYAARKDLGGGALRTLDHDIDFLNWCLGEPESVIGCRQRTGSIEVEANVDDHAVVVIRYRSGVIGAVETALCRPDPSRGFELVGTAASLRYRFDTARLELLRDYGKTVELLADHGGYDINDMYVAMLDDYVKMLTGRGHTEAVADPEAGLRAIEVCGQAEAHSSPSETQPTSGV